MKLINYDSKGEPEVMLERWPNNFLFVNGINMKLRVTYTVDYETEIDVSSLDDIDDAICNIDVPENDESKYIGESFDVVGITDRDGKRIDY